MKMTFNLVVKGTGDDECGMPHLRCEAGGEIVTVGGLTQEQARQWASALYAPVRVTIETIPLA